jgi:hypothetical protein
MRNFYSFLGLSSQIFRVYLKTFWRISAKHRSCWRPYCAVGVPSDAIFYYCCWLVSTISGILAVAGLPSAVDICDVPNVSVSVA